MRILFSVTRTFFFGVAIETFCNKLLKEFYQEVPGYSSTELERAQKLIANLGLDESLEEVMELQREIDANNSALGFYPEEEEEDQFDMIEFMDFTKDTIYKKARWDEFVESMADRDDEDEFVEDEEDEPDEP